MEMLINLELSGLMILHFFYFFLFTPYFHPGFSQLCLLVLSDDNIWAVACDLQQCGILTSVDSEEHVQPPFKLCINLKTSPAIIYFCLFATNTLI